MLTTVVQIGNSRGVRIPKNILRDLQIENKVEMIVHDGALLIKNAEIKPRKDWDEAFANMSKNRDDVLIMPENLDSDDFEWVW